MTLAVIAAIASLLACGLLAGMETGVYTINRVRLAVRAGQGWRGARLLRAELLKSNRLLATLLVGMNFAHAGLSAATTSVLDQWQLDPATEVMLNTAVVMPLVFLVGDALPKELFRVFANSWMYGCAWILTALRIAFTWTGIVPVVRGLGEMASRLLGAKPDRQEPERKRVLQALREGHQVGVIGGGHIEIADRIFGLSERPVSECVLPLRKAVVVPAVATTADREAILRASSFSRYPVVTWSLGRVEITGIVSALDLLLEPTKSPAELAQPPLVIAPETSVLDAARKMRQSRRTMAVVGTPGASPLGIITLKDVLEPVVGQTAVW